jgi:3',5'-cyclic AMP phosphodiesterase CpdA
MTRMKTGKVLRLSLLLLLGLLVLAPQAWVQSLPGDWLGANLRAIAIADPGDFSFAVFGDNRDDQGRFNSLISQVNRDPAIAFCLDLGDLVNHPDPALYRHFFRQVQNLGKPLLTVIGNHEINRDPAYGRRLYADIFGPSVGPFYYSFHFGNYYFIVLDDADKQGPDPAQKAWLEAELQKAGAYKYRFVFLHVPLYDPTGGRHCLPQADADKLLALFKAHQVSQIFAGHIHAYFQGDWGGIPFVITGGAGVPLVRYDDTNYFFHWLKVRATDTGFKISVNKFIP